MEDSVILAAKRLMDAMDRNLPQAVFYERTRVLRQALTYYYSNKAQEEIELAFPIAAE